MNIDIMQIGLHLLNFVIILAGFAIGLVIAVGIPLIIIYAIYRAVKSLMTYNAEPKSRYNQGQEDTTETRWTSGQ